MTTFARPRVAVVGGGFGGLAAVRALDGADLDVTLIDRNNYHLFQPLLYQVATAALSPSEISHPIRTALRRQRNVRVVLGDVLEVDLDAHELRLADRTISYDYLVLAPGSRPFYFGHPPWAVDAPGLKSLEDALDIRRRVLLAFERAEQEPDEARRRALLTFVIVGGGATGVELAGAIGEAACHALRRDFRFIDTTQARVVLVEAGSRILAAFPPQLSARAEDGLRRRCVEVRVNSPVEEIGVGRINVAGEVLASDTVVWAAGVRPDPVIESLGVPLDRAGRVVVNADLRVDGYPGVFVVGDAAVVLDSSGRALPGVAPVAIQEGRHAGRSIRRSARGEHGRPFRYADFGSMAAIGRGNAVVSVTGLRLSGLLGWWIWVLVHIARLIGFRSRLVVMLDWAWAYIRRQWAARLILAPFAGVAGDTRGVGATRSTGVPWCGTTTSLPAGTSGGIHGS